jgi:alkylation response protein AidB-like acyl-CoA dehydrogenase
VTYTAPIADMRFTLRSLVGLEELARLPGCENAAPDLVDAVLEEAGKLASEVIAPLNAVGDRQRAVLENGIVRTPEGFKDAYRRYVEGGWNALPFDPEHGGQGLPWAIAIAVAEMWNSANMGWALCPLLNVGAVELLEAHGSPAQKATFLPKMISGEWTGTMNLTEPQAGSDVGALRTRAVREGDHYRITGQKIFITYGDHDWTQQIVHMVLARTPDAPAGSRGISLFIVPKFLVKEDGSLGARNDVRTVSLEHKLGIHASPTCVLAYGDNGGAIGYLVGAENRGLECMFTMMNNARLNVGLQGVAIAERAYQQARDYARARVQGNPIGAKASALPIAYHPDVKRMLLGMRARTEAARALAYYAAGAIDRARRHPDRAESARQQALADLLIPIVKAWCTDTAVDVASEGVQVHGGMGFIEETGAAQHYRDARILPIYEGTNGIQANDLVGRKLGRDGGEAARTLLAALRREAAPLGVPELGPALDAVETATEHLVAAIASDAPAAAAGSVAYLRLFGTTLGAALLGRAALAAKADPVLDPRFVAAKQLTARFFAEQYLPPAAALLAAVRAGGTALQLDPETL